MVRHNNTKYFLIMCLVGLFLIAVIVSNLFPDYSFRRQAQAQSAGQTEDISVLSVNKPFQKHKILHVMSYHSPWEWTDIQYEGFKTALESLNVQYDLIQMDTKRKNNQAWRDEITTEIMEFIDGWKPSLIYTSDDDAQRYVAQKFVNAGIPIVFSGVNAQPDEYGFNGSCNITGVLERMHFAATLKLLKKLAPQVQKVVLISDNGKMWPGIIEQLKQQESQYPDIRVLGYEIVDTYQEFQNKISACQTQADAIGLLGIFEFRNENNENVPQDEVMRWLAQNSKLPDFSFWKDRVDKGTLCAVTVSGYAQGYQAGLLARSILADGTSPADLPIVPTKKGIPIINLQTADRLGIRPDAETLLTADVVRKSVLE